MIMYFFLSQYSHRISFPLNKKSSFQRFRGFQEDHYEFYDPIIEWLEQSHLESSLVNNKFRYYISLAKEFGVYGDISVRSF